MKKIICALFIVLLAILGVLGALAVLPHAHGSDLDHSQNESCPVFQAGLAHSDASLALAAVLVFSIFVSWFAAARPSIAESFSAVFVSSRAPPAAV